MNPLYLVWIFKIHHNNMVNFTAKSISMCKRYNKSYDKYQFFHLFLQKKTKIASPINLSIVPPCFKAISVIADR